MSHDLHKVSLHIHILETMELDTFLFLLQVAESYVLERENLEKRAYSDPDDPR